MKKKITLLTAAIAAALAAGCSGGAGNTASKTTEITNTGILTMAADYQIQITAEDGTVYTYAVDDTTQIDAEDENLGDTVEVTSMGDAEGVHADKIIVSQTADPETAPVEVQTIYGQVYDNVNASITVTTDDGNNYIIKKDDNTISHTAEGISIGDYVEIAYSGDLMDESAVAHSIIPITEAENQNAAAAANAMTSNSMSRAMPAGDDDVIRYITGTCISDTMNAVQVDYYGVTYNVPKDDTTLVYGNIGVGDRIRIFHKGHLHDGMHATKIVLIEKAEPAPKPQDDFDTRKLYGKITDASNASIMIRNDYGDEWFILKDDNTKVNSDISVDTPVEVICYINGNGAYQATVIN